MSEQFQNPNAVKPEDTTTSNSPEEKEKKVEQIANKAAEKPAKTEQKYDKDHPIFSK
jgi:hypothetical protein